MTREEAIIDLNALKFILDNDQYTDEIEEALDTAISALQQPEIVRCKDCKWWGYDDDDGVVRVCHAAKHGHMSSNWSIMIYRTHKGDFYCADAERKEGETE